MISNEEAQIKVTLKKLMKKKGLNQRALAEKLGTSLPTVRRILTKERLSIDRLIEICRILETTLSSLVSIATGMEEQHTFLNEEQENFFATNPHFYQYLRLLGRGLSPRDIEKEYQITPKTTLKYLVKLEGLQIIRRLNNNGIKLLIKWPHTFRFPGPLQRKFHKSLGRVLVDHLSEKSASSPNGWDTEFFYFINLMRLSPKNYKKCVQEFSELSTRYRQISKIDQETWPWRQLVTAGGILGIDKIDPLLDVMGPVKNL